MKTMRPYKFFHGYIDKSITEEWEELMQQFPTITTYPVWTGTTYTPTWVVNPDLIQYTPPNYTITTTPGTGYITLPYNATINTATGFSLTTSNPNGITYTTGGIGGTLTTGTATFSNSAFTTNFK